MNGDRKDNSGVRFPPPLIYVGVLAAGFVLQAWRPIAIADGAGSAAVRLAGALLIAAGASISVSGVLAFRRAGTSPNPTKPTAALALDGPYRFTRNPMYLGLAVASAGIAAVFNALWPLVLLPVTVVLVTRLVIVREERYLDVRFGEEYRRYRARVRRWI